MHIAQNEHFQWFLEPLHMQPLLLQPSLLQPSLLQPSLPCVPLV